LLFLPNQEVPTVVDEFNWCFCPVVGEKVISTVKVILVGDPVDSVFDSHREVVGVSGSYRDVKVWVVGELNVWPRWHP
jgi:hypothetical protein